MTDGGASPTRKKGIKCPACRKPLPLPPPGEGEGTPRAMACPHCKARLNVTTFPARHDARRGMPATDIQSDQEASCFYHSHKQAVTVCDRCGRFLCALCEVTWHRETLCPACITRGRKRQSRVHDLSLTRTRYDTQVLQLGILPIVLPIFWWGLWITAPLVLIMAIRYRNRPCSFLPGRKTRLRFALGAILALIQLVISAFVLVGFKEIWGLHA